MATRAPGLRAAGATPRTHPPSHGSPPLHLTTQLTAIIVADAAASLSQVRPPICKLGCVGDACGCGELRPESKVAGCPPRWVPGDVSHMHDTASMVPAIVTLTLTLTLTLINPNPNPNPDPNPNPNPLEAPPPQVPAIVSLNGVQIGHPVEAGPDGQGKEHGTGGSSP